MSLENPRQRRQRIEAWQNTGGSLAPAPGSDEVGHIGPGWCDQCQQEYNFVITLSGGVKLCRGCTESEHPNAERSHGAENPKS